MVGLVTKYAGGVVKGFALIAGTWAGVFRLSEYPIAHIIYNVWQESW